MADPEIRIRKAHPADCPALTAIAHAAKRHWGYPEEWIHLWRDDLTVTPAVVAEQAVFCAVREDEVVGFCAISGGGGQRELEHLWVSPEHMRRGIGRRLLAHAVETLRAEGLVRLEIASDPYAESFYRSVGARRVGEVASTPGDRTLPLLLLDAEEIRRLVSVGALR